jgi:hypothetical protein
LPPGRFTQRISQLSGRHCPLDLVAILYSEFRDVIFKSHPSLKLFKFLDHRPQDMADDSAQFLFYFIRTISFLLGITPSDVGELLTHCISIDVYARPLSVWARSLPSDLLPQISEHRNNLAFTERAVMAIGKLPAIALVNAFHCPVLAVVPSMIAGRTVISKVDLAGGDFICELYGIVQLLEEADEHSLRPTFTQIWVTGTPLMIDTTEHAAGSIHTRIRRSVFYNCEVRLFTVQGRSRIGIFAIAPSVLPFLGNKRSVDGFVIRKDDELLLPFDIMPVIRKFDGEWRTLKGKRIDIDIEILRPHATLGSEREETLAFEEGDADKPKTKVREAESLFGFLMDEGEIPFTITPGDGEDRPRRPDLPRIISKFHPPGRKPPDPRPQEFEPPPEFREKEPELPVQSSRFAIIRELAGIIPREPWDLTADFLGPTEADLRH